MESDAILSFNTPLLGVERVEVSASPVLELTYSHYFLTRRLRLDNPPEVEWVRTLMRQHAGLLDDLRGFWSEAEAGSVSHILMFVASEMGFAQDDEVERFLRDLPELPERLLARIDGGSDRGDLRSVDPEETEKLVAGLSIMAEEGRAEGFRDLLEALWAVLDPLWRERGRQAVGEAVGRFQAKFRDTGDVLAALPTHHFTQFEAAAAQIRASQEHGRILVTPLYFASEGGFNYRLHDTHFIGFGVQSESIFEQRHTRLTEVAGRIKAFADPTRLMLLALIARFPGMTMTVGDLADQLGVSQPTVSGHLKVLREAELVTLEKHGNKSFYRVDAVAVRHALTDLENAVLSG